MVYALPYLPHTIVCAGTRLIQTDFWTNLGARVDRFARQAFRTRALSVDIADQLIK